MNQSTMRAGLLVAGLLVLALAAYYIYIVPAVVIVPPNHTAVIVPANNTAVIVPPEKVAVIVPVPVVTPGVPHVVFIGVTTVPVDLAKNQGVINNIVITFSEAMDPATVNQNTFMVKGPNNAAISGAITSDATKKVWTFNPANSLGFNLVYNVTVTTGAKGVSGNSLVKNFLWSFTTEYGGGAASPSPTPTPSPTPAPAAPVLTTITLSPASASIAVGAKQQLAAASLDQFGASIAATIIYTTSNSSIATVNTTGAVSAVAAGNATITATSGAVSNTSRITVTSVGSGGGPAAVNLGTAGNFAILSKAGISDTGSHSSVITGDIGNSPITYTGPANVVWCPEITGKIYGVDEAYVGNGDVTCFVPGTTSGTPNANKTYVDNAVLNMSAAYTDAAGRVNGTGSPDYLNEGSGILEGLTLYPGIHKWGTAVTIGVTTPGSVTLDCQGNSSAVFIFQIAGTLDIGSGGSVPTGNKILLTNSCQAKNLFWAVTGVTTLGTYSTFEGNILTTGTSTIALQTGAVLNGRALSDGAVTLDANPVTKPV